MRRKGAVAVFGAVAMLGLAGCGNDQASESDGGAQVAVTLDDYSIDPSPTSVSGGKVTFDVENAGATEHEMVVIRTDLDPSDIPVENHEANEEAPGMTAIGEVEDVQPGESTVLNLTLESGRYLLLCNIAKHFERGMVTEFQVG
jgi:uncharacterized cupredoxin-like copper-binding protein